MIKNIFASSCLLSFLIAAHLQSSNVVHDHAADDHVLFETKSLQLLIPDHSIASGSVEVKSKTHRHYVDWTEDEHAEAYSLLQKIAQLWQRRGISEYVVLGREGKGKDFRWEAVPFPKEESGLWKQLKVAYRIFYGGSPVEAEERRQMNEQYRNDRGFLESPLVQQEHQESVGNDPFCQPSVIAQQQVIDDPQKSVVVLYDYKPLVKHHFLVIPRAHEEKFSDLPMRSYLEASSYAEKLIQKYATPGVGFYLLHKTGKGAGQSVPHWHMHVILPQSEKEESSGELHMLFKMFWGGSRLPQEEMKDRIHLFRDKLD